MYYFNTIIARHLKATIQANQNQWLFFHWLSWNLPAVSSLILVLQFYYSMKS